MIAAISQMETHIGKKEVIEYLKSEADNLRDKLRGVEQSIATLERLFTTNTPIEKDNGKESPTTQASAEVIPLKKRGQPIPSTYDTNGTYARKILYILNKEDEMSTSQLIHYILDKEPELNQTEESRKRVSVNVAKCVTRLADKKRVAVEKLDHQNYYRLK